MAVVRMSQECREVLDKMTQYVTSLVECENADDIIDDDFPGESRQTVEEWVDRARELLFKE